MSIQSTINQSLALPSLLFSQSSIVKSRKEGLSIQKKQEQAVRGLADIEKNLVRESASRRIGPPTLEEANNPKSYNLEELENIDSRVNQYQTDIYDAKSAALNPSYKKYINPNYIKQGDLSKQLSTIREMSSKAKEALNAKKIEMQASKDFKNMILEGVTSPLNDPRG